MPDKKNPTFRKDFESDFQAFNEQVYQTEKTEGEKSIEKNSQETGQERDKMAKMGLKQAKNKARSQFE
jgi:hypothetical protein